jgi:hypothetical protein
MTYRLLITGSRSWTDGATIATAIVEAKQKHEDLLIVNGGCPRGADQIAQYVARLWKIPTEIHPADWKTHRRRAGMIRNAEMVRLGADECLAFIRGDSAGASACAAMAKAAGIPTAIYRTDEDT